MFGNRRTQRIVAVASLAALLLPAAHEMAGAEQLQGIVRAVNQASLSTDAPMRLTRLPFREGHLFKAADIIAEFDCRRSHADQQMAAAALREAQLNLEASLKLDGYKAIGKHELEVSRARLEKAKGEYRLSEARVEDCVVRAPFAGRVAEAPTRVWEFTVAQRPFLTIIEEGNFEIDFIVPSSAISTLTVGRRFAFRIEEIGDAVGEAVVSAIIPTVDPVSKTGRMIAKVLTAPPQLAAGMGCIGLGFEDSR